MEKQLDNAPGDGQIYRYQLGPLVRETWINWAEKQSDPDRYDLTPWDELDDSQKEIDQLIGEAVAERVLDNYEDFPRHLVPKARAQQLYNCCQEQAEVIKALNRTMGALMNQVGQYQEKAIDACKTQLAISRAGTVIDTDYAIIKHVDALTELRELTLTKQAVDMGPYYAVDFTRLASDYIKLREAAKGVLVGMAKTSDASLHCLVSKKPLTVLAEALKQYPTCDWGPCTDVPMDQEVIAGLGRMVPVQITTVGITPHVKELVAMLEPDAEVEALVYEKGKAVITEVSAKLAALTQAVGEFLYNYPYQNTPGKDPYEPLHKLEHLYHILTQHMTLQEAAGDPVGYATLKLKMLQIAAQGMLKVFYGESPTPEAEIKRRADLRTAVDYLEAILEQIGETGPHNKYHGSLEHNKPNFEPK